MKKNPWKTVTWVVEIVFLFLALTAPLNPILTTKVSVFAWCFTMMGLGCIGVLLAALKGYPPEDFSLKD
jgi:high-affinity Fe2+/Pb2+ permease